MNKAVVIVSAIAVTLVGGCKDPGYGDKPYASVGYINQDVKCAGEITADASAEIHCACKPGAKHDAPCKCGAPDCKCEVTVAPISAPIAEPQVQDQPQVADEYTTYIVQKGDYLAKISKKFNIRIDTIKALNKLKSDKIRLGQKLMLPGKLDVGVQEEYRPQKPAPKPFKPYEGPTFEYVVKSGDTLGAIAYGHGINIRQLKALNNLKKDNLKIGQKLKVPVVDEKSAEPVVEPKADAPVIAEPVAEDPLPPPPAEAEDATIPTVVEDVTYIVQEGDDITGVAIRWGITAAVIRDLNNLAEDAQLVPGQILKLPADIQQ